MRQMILIDPATGQPRDPTAAELQALQSQQTVEVPPQPIVSPTAGLTGLALSEDQMLYTVATRKKDGTVALQEISGKHATDRQVQTGSSEVLRTGKEAADDR